MFRSMSGFKGHYHFLTLLVIAEFNEWRVLLYGPDGVIHGPREFNEAKAKEHALAIARRFVHDYKHESLPLVEDAEWKPTDEANWLIWNP